MKPLRYFKIQSITSITGLESITSITELCNRVNKPHRWGYEITDEDGNIIHAVEVQKIHHNLDGKEDHFVIMVGNCGHTEPRSVCHKADKADKIAHNLAVKIAKYLATNKKSSYYRLCYGVSDKTIEKQ